MCGHWGMRLYSNNFFSSYLYALFFQSSNHNKLTCRYIILVCMHYYINIATRKQLTCSWAFELWTRATKVWPETEKIWKLKEAGRYLFPPPKIMLLQKQQNLSDGILYWLTNVQAAHARKEKGKKKKGRDLEFRPTELLQPNQSRSFRRQLFFYFFILNSSFLHWEWVEIWTSTFNIHVIYS